MLGLFICGGLWQESNANLDHIIALAKQLQVLSFEQSSHCPSKCDGM
jgi:hypothetical protein